MKLILSAEQFLGYLLAHKRVEDNVVEFVTNNEGILEVDLDRYGIKTRAGLVEYLGYLEKNRLIGFIEIEVEQGFKYRVSLDLLAIQDYNRKV